MDITIPLADTRKGWLFCLNAPLEPGSGSKWGYLNDFYEAFEPKTQFEDTIYRANYQVWGKPTSKKLRLLPGDCLAIYHGKKSRKGSSPQLKKRHVKPYQLSLLATICDVDQDEQTGEVKELELAYSRKLFDNMRQQPLLLDDERLRSIVNSSGLGKGPTGAFFPIIGEQWLKLLEIVGTEYPALGGHINGSTFVDRELEPSEGTKSQYVDQFNVGDVEPRKESIQGTRFHRNPVVRKIVLERSAGRCELCGELGFTTKTGSIYLETHHIIPLSEGGSDQPNNVIGLCPKHHRQSHYGEQAEDIRKLLASKLSGL